MVFELPDGARLVSDHYYPPGWPKAGPKPTLLVRQPYGKAIATTVVCAQPEWFARQGYNVVIQDVRGRGASSGSFYPFRNEADDGFHTIEWISRRPECNGRVGMYGFSYQGLTQLLAAARQPEALRCMAPAQTAGDLYHGWFYHHGALRLASTAGWAAQLLRADAHRLGLRREAGALDAVWANLPGLYGRTPYGRIPELTSSRLPPYFRDWVAHWEPGDYWSRLDLTRMVERIQIPGLHIWGWFDSYLHGSALLYDALRARAGSAFARENQWLIAGPWVHIPWGRHAGESDFGDAAALDTDSLHIRWFNHWLKDSGEFDAEPRWRLFAMGDDRWHTPAQWAGYEGEPAAWKAFHLRSDGRANSSRGDGVLAPQAPASEEPWDAIVYEPDAPPGSPGPQGAAGQFNQVRAAALNITLVYTSAPLERRLHICGAPRLNLYSSATSPWHDWCAKLCRVTADGRSLNVSIGIARSTWLFPGGAPPGKPVLWQFPLEPTDCVFAPGERIRLEISGGAFPLYDRNPGSPIAPPAARPSDWSQVRQSALHTRSHPSRVDLPLPD